MKSRSIQTLFVAFFLTFVGCGKGSEFLVKEVVVTDNLVGSCSESTPCPDGYVCVGDVCVESIGDSSCHATQAPELTASHQMIQFGNIARTGMGERKLEITNDGDCTLILSEAGLQSNDGIFSCSDCTDEPIYLPPLRKHVFTITASTDAAGSFAGTFLVSTNDPTLPQGGQLAVEVEATHLGTPDMAIEPFELRYGHIPVGDRDASGARREHRKPFDIRNIGTGEQSFYVRLRPSSSVASYVQFDEVGLGAFPEDFIELKPGEALSDMGSFAVVFQTPTSGMAQDYIGHLVVETYIDDPLDISQAEVPLTATSISPAELNAPEEAEFLCEDDQPCAVNIESKLRVLSIQNIGQTDFRYDRVFIAPRSAQLGSDLHFQLVGIGNSHETGGNNLESGVISRNGGFINIHIKYDPLDTSDIASPEAPTMSHDAKLIFRNDVEDRNIEVDLSGWARIVPSRDAFTVELSWNKRSGNDFRTAFIEMNGDAFSAEPGTEYRYPHSCLLDTSGNNPDYCSDEWRYGSARYTGAGQNPQIMSVAHMPTEEAREAVFDVDVRYPSSCIRVESWIGQVVGGVLAIVDIVLGVMYGIVLPVDINAAIEEVNSICEERASLNGRIEVKQNGEVIHSRAFTMTKNEEGLAKPVIRIHRRATMELEFEDL